MGFLKVYFTVFAVILLFPGNTKCNGSVYFKVEGKNSTKYIIVCRFGKEFQEHYFDIYKNDGPCVTAGAGVCAEVRNSGCKCEKRMGKNEVRLRIDSPHEYDTLKCRVLNGVSREKTIIVTLDDGNVGNSEKHKNAATQAAVTCQPWTVLAGISFALTELMILHATGSQIHC